MPKITTKMDSAAMAEPNRKNAQANSPASAKDAEVEHLFCMALEVAHIIIRLRVKCLKTFYPRGVCLSIYDFFKF